MQKFILKIDVQSPDGETVRCQSQIKFECSPEIAISALASIMQKDENLKRIFGEATLLAISNEKFAQVISHEEFQKASDTSDPDF